MTAERAPRFPVAVELLRDELERLERNHYSTGPERSSDPLPGVRFTAYGCPECTRARDVRAELERLER